MLSPSQTQWIILAGGQASRMDGNDKGLIKLNGRPLIEHVLERLTPQTNDIWINANRNQHIYQQYAPVISDVFDNYPGPLAGMHSGLTHCTKEWVGFVPCDSPLINTDLVDRFCQTATANCNLLVAHDGESQQPVFTLLNRSLLPSLTDFLNRGERKLMWFIRECHTIEVDFSDSPDCFLNLNTPDELAHFGELRS